MKRQRSNRGEALSEVTAARALANRKALVRTSFMTQTDRQTNWPFWSSQRVEVRNPRKRKHPKGKEEDTILL